MNKFFVGLFATVVIWVIALIPLWVFVGEHDLISPEGFFQEFFVFGIGVWFLGGAQIVLAITGIAVNVVVWDALHE